MRAVQSLLPLGANGSFPRIPFGQWVRDLLDWSRENLGVVFNAIRDLVSTVTGAIADVLTAPPSLVVAAILALLAWAVGTWKLGLLSAAMLLFVIGVNQWDNTMLTLALVIFAAGVALLIGIPVGILAARSDRFSRMIRPVLDFMQTMPAFVWLVPVVMLFRVGMTPAVVATIIFCLPPGVRLTELGIRGVDKEVVEAGHAFGSTRGQILRRIQLPLALPTIMAGVNQVIMLALSMAVIAGLTGAPGLGREVTSAIGTLDVGLGFEAGISVVVLAIYLDRVTAAIGTIKPGSLRSSWLGRKLRGTRADAPPPESTDSTKTASPATATTVANP